MKPRSSLDDISISGCKQLIQYDCCLLNQICLKVLWDLENWGLQHQNMKILFLVTHPHELNFVIILIQVCGGWGVEIFYLFQRIRLESQRLHSVVTGSAQKLRGLKRNAYELDCVKAELSILKVEMEIATDLLSSFTAENSTINKRVSKANMQLYRSIQNVTDSYDSGKYESIVSKK